MTYFKRIYGHNSPEQFPAKPLPPIFLGPPKPNGAIPAFTRERPVYAPPPEYIAPRVTVPPPPEVPPPPVDIKKSTLWGIVTDCRTGVGISGATVVLDGQTEHTDAMGKYVFKNVEPGNYALYVFKAA